MHQLNVLIFGPSSFVSTLNELKHFLKFNPLSNDLNADHDVILFHKEALKNKDMQEVADALTDILYVTYGAGHAFGINLDKCFDEVQNSNMSKLGDDGKPIYHESGKVKKGPNYFKPNLKKFLWEKITIGSL